MEFLEFAAKQAKKVQTKLDKASDMKAAVKKMADQRAINAMTGSKSMEKVKIKHKFGGGRKSQISDTSS